MNTFIFLAHFVFIGGTFVAGVVLGVLAADRLKVHIQKLYKRGS